jgi:hypothetical protein
VITKLGGRKFIVVMFSLVAGSVIAFTCKADVLAAYANLASICVAAFMAAHGAADWKNGKVSP